MSAPNLLVSSSSRAFGRARREIVWRLRALGDPAPQVERTAVTGLIAVRTTLDPRGVVQRLRALCETAPWAFRSTCRWVPVDLWVAADLQSMGRAVASLRERIGPAESWRMTVEERGQTFLAAGDVIRALAALIDARVDLSHPDKILLVDVFADRAALSVVAPSEIFSVTKARAPRPAQGPDEPAGAPGPASHDARAVPRARD